MITNTIAKGFSNKTTGTKMTWWKTSFNMPVKNIFDSNAIYTETEGMLNSINPATSFDLSGFEAGWETFAGASVFTIYGPFAGGVVTCKQTWKNTLGNTIFTNQTDVNFPSLASGYWSSWQLASNQGVASWEINTNGTYQLVSTMSGAYTDSTTTNITITNCPSVTTYSPTGMMWVEGNNFRWCSANGHLHTVVGTDIANPGATPGYIWIDGNYIYWIGNNGHKYRGPYNFKQFTSSFSNGAPGGISGATSGYMWMDNQFGWEHIGYIASDGTKWIFNSGEDPYV